MPIHTYKCTWCETITEKKVPFSDIPDFIDCQNCQRLAIRQIANSFNVIYKGAGFSKTDKKKSYDPFDKADLDKGMERTVK